VARVCIDVQHIGKPNKPRDRGAAWPADGSGLVEVHLTLGYAVAMERALHDLGHEVFLLVDGYYGDRHKRVNALAPDLYLACHVNAGMGGKPYNRGEFYHWPQSSNGHAAAQAIAEAVAAVAPWRCEVKPADSSRTQATMDGVRAPTVLLEPGFLDGLDASWLQQSHTLGGAMASGVDAYLRRVS